MTNMWWLFQRDCSVSVGKWNLEMHSCEAIQDEASYKMCR
jgi:hypothetical protein